MKLISTAIRTLLTSSDKPSLVSPSQIQPLLTSLLHRYWCFCVHLCSAFLQAAGARKSAEGTLRGRTQESLWHSFLLFQVHPLQYTPYYPAVIPLWLSFPPQAVILVLNFDETKPGVARGIYLFRSKCSISVNILELQRRMIGQLLLSVQNGFLYFYQSVKGNTCLESTNVFFLSDIPDTFGCTLKLVLALNSYKYPQTPKKS